ncbi:MAG: diacylglycerol/lipid kinase family protein [Lachnospiraceae bacterium]|jgi:diacylglycerol kinase family enzyme
MIFHVIVNPAGASGKTGKIYRRLMPYLKKSRHRFVVHLSSEEKGIEEVTREAVREARSGQPAARTKKEPVNLIVLGGDGTLNEVINGIDDYSDVRIGFLPAGSGNDLARSLKLPKNLKALSDQILEGRTVRRMDVGEVICHDAGQEADRGWRRRFLSSCGVGYDAAICYYAGRSPFKKVLNRLHLGKLIYLVYAFRLILSYPNTGQVIYESGRVLETFPNCLFSVYMNNRYEGGGIQFCPHADNSDGILDYCAADPKRNSEFFLIVPFTFSGKKYPFFARTMHQGRAGRTVRVKASVPQWVHTDGEVKRRSADLTVRILPEKLQMLD